MSIDSLQLVTVGEAAPAMLKELEAPLALHLQLKALPSKISLDTPNYAFNKDRKQYHSNAILRRLSALATPTGGVLGLTDVDLFIPDTEHVFGEADREARAAVVSIHRLRLGVSLDILRQRLQREVLHQAGHLVGLSVCEDARCVMSVSTDPAELDKKHAGYCNLCKNELARLR
ncbi:MAG TPA: archaemetzincin [Myxococcaceae bacterium]|nr:archaemetzincin [Myxococcaceae bacterium]